MNQEEEKIRKMFQEQKAEDELNAPSFAGDWNAALSRVNETRPRWVPWQISAGVAAGLILLGTGWWVLFEKSPQRLERAEIVTSNASAPETLPRVLPSSAPKMPSPAFRQTAPEILPQISRSRFRVKNLPQIALRRGRSRSQPQTALNSQWRSPTESLLRIPGEQLFKRVPRLDDSVVNIKATISNQKN